MVTGVVPSAAPARTMPTAIPSGMLCSVTARMQHGAFAEGAFGAFALAAKMDMGHEPVQQKQKAHTKEKAGGRRNKGEFSIPSDISMAGIISDQTEAATITPEANAKKALSEPPP